jgi:hypothetical protein
VQRVSLLKQPVRRSWQAGHRSLPKKKQAVTGKALHAKAVHPNLAPQPILLHVAEVSRAEAYAVPSDRSCSFIAPLVRDMEGLAEELDEEVGGHS